MSEFESGVKGYVHGVAVVNVFFPIDMQGKKHKNCFQCQFFSRNNGVCQLTKDVVAFPQHYIGANCPLEFKEEI